MSTKPARPPRPEPGVPIRGADKVARIPVKVIPTDTPLKKPAWLKVRLPTESQALKVRDMLRDNKLHTVCEEASCPNLQECFGSGTATFMILGQVCTRRCPFCDVGHGRPLPISELAEEPAQLADAVSKMKLRYVVITSVDRDDLRDGGATHFADCVRAVREARPGVPQSRAIGPAERAEVSCRFLLPPAKESDAVMSRKLGRGPFCTIMIRSGRLWSRAVLKFSRKSSS